MIYSKALIMWRSKTQKTTALPTAEAEYYSASTAEAEVMCFYFKWILLERMGFAQ